MPVQGFSLIYMIVLIHDDTICIFLHIQIPMKYPKLYCENKHQYKEVNHIVIIIVDCQHKPEI